MTQEFFDPRDPPATIGGYLRALRVSRRLSLVDVVRLSRSFAEKIDKGALSRFENDQQRIPASKLVLLGRIYNLPADLLMQRLEWYLQRGKRESSGER